MSPASVTPAGSSQGPQCELAGRAGLPRDSHLLHSLHQCDRHTWVRNLRRAEWASRLLRRRPQLATKPESQRPHFPPSPAPPPPEGQSWAVTARYTCPWKEAVREAGGSSARHRTRPAGRWGARSAQRRGKGVPRGETRGKGVPGERPPGKGQPRGRGRGGPPGRGAPGKGAPGEARPRGKEPPRKHRGPALQAAREAQPLARSTRCAHRHVPAQQPRPSATSPHPFAGGRATPGAGSRTGRAGATPRPLRNAVCADPTARETLPL